MPKFPVEHGVVISYVPLFNEEPPWDLKQGEGREWLQRHGVSGRAQGLIWRSEPDLAICFVMEHGIAIGNHLVEWSCGSPSIHFTCYYKIADDCYALMLMPNLALAKMQFAAAQYALFGRSLAHNASLEYVYRPIIHSSFSVEGLKDLTLGSTIRVGFTDQQQAGAVMLPPLDLRPAEDCTNAATFLDAVIQQMIEYKEANG